MYRVEKVIWKCSHGVVDNPKNNKKHEAQHHFPCQGMKCVQKYEQKIKIEVVNPKSHYANRNKGINDRKYQKYIRGSFIEI